MKTIYTNHIYSYLSLRKSIGIIAILLPFVILIITTISGEGIPSSISYSYYSTARDVFVGSLCAIALLMFFYTGYSKIDNWAGNIVGLSSLGTVWFPPTPEGNEIDLVAGVHYVSALLLFLALSFFCLFLFTKSDVEKDLRTANKKIRNKIYIACGVIMLLCLAIMIYIFSNEKLGGEGTVLAYILQTVSTVAFGFSWLVKGNFILKD